MRITIIAEPRSGSTNLGNWFFNKKNFTVLYEPISNPNIEWYQNGKHPSLWEYDTEHLLIKETYTVETNYTDLLEISDKVIVLYRENNDEQLSSWKNALLTKNWDKPWVYKEKLDTNKTINTDYFFDIKEGIKKNFLDKDYFRITYEELYYNNGFQKVVDYLNIEGVENIEFPYGQKYRINLDKPLISLI